MSMRVVTRSINEFLQSTYQKKLISQFAATQVIPRTLVDYQPIHYYGRDEYLSPLRPSNLNQLGVLHIYYHPQAIPRPYYFFVEGPAVFNTEIVDPKIPDRLFLEGEPEVTTWDNRLHKIHIVQRWVALQHAKNGQVDVENAYIFSSRAWNNYYHFITDTCLRYIDLAEAGGLRKDTKLIIHREFDSLLSWQRQYIGILGLPREKFVVAERAKLLPGRKPLKVGRLLIASPRRHRFACSPDAIRSFQALVRTAMGLTTPKSRKRIYIKRKKRNGSRHISNNCEVESLLQSMGFQVVELEGISVREQIAIFYDADTIVSPHGAGLTNLIHCYYAPKVVELFPTGFWTFGYYIHLVEALGGMHCPVVGGQQNSNGGYEISISELAESLNF